MKAVIHDKYGSPDFLKIKDVDEPNLGENDVLIRVHAAGLHIGDSFTVRGAPFPVRMETGLLKPKYGIPGYDVAGEVTAVGDRVRRFQPGDEVFGSCHGSCAEFVSTAEKLLAPKPEGLSLTEAAAVPTSGLAALHALRDVGRLQPGKKVLINGASGGVGTFAVQLAKAFGAEVTGVSSTGNVDLVRSLGADHVIDYTQEDFVAGGLRYHLIFDNVENRPLSECRQALLPNGTLILNSGTGASGFKFFVRLVKPLIVAPFVRHRLRRYLSVPTSEDLLVLKELIEAGSMKPVIDRTFSLSETADAIRYLETGRARGKVVIRVRD